MGTAKRIFGIGFFDDEYEKETSFTSAVIRNVGDFVEANISMVKEEVRGKFPTTGSINFKDNPDQIEQLQKQQTEQTQERAKIDRKKGFLQALKEEMNRAKSAKDKLLFEEEINDIVTNLPTEQKNRLLHYQASYKDRSIYQRAELRRKIIEEQKNTEKKEKAASITSPAKQASAINAAMEGGSGSQGGGTANLSANAVG